MQKGRKRGKVFFREIPSVEENEARIQKPSISPVICSQDKCIKKSIVI